MGWVTIPNGFTDAERIRIGDAFDAAQVDWTSEAVERFNLEGHYMAHDFEISFAASDRRRAVKVLMEVCGYHEAGQLDPRSGACPGCDAILERAWQCPSCELNFGQVQDDPLGRFLQEQARI